jgi:hypothetical protein
MDDKSEVDKKAEDIKEDVDKMSETISGDWL